MLVVGAGARPGLFVPDAGDDFGVIQPTTESEIQLLDPAKAIAPSYESPANYEMELMQEEGGGSGGADGQQDNGTNPAQNARTLIVSNEFYQLADTGNKINTTFARFKLPIVGGRGALLFEMPFNYYDIAEPVSGQVGGLGDLKFQINFNAWTSPSKQLTFLTMMEFYIPSADNVLLTQVPDANEFIGIDVGKGKFQLGPGLGLVYAFAPNFIFAPLYFYEFSVAGSDARPDVRRGKWRVFMMYAFPSGFYTLPEFQALTDYESGNNDLYFAPEFGYSTKGTTFYTKPGFGISPDANDREWGIEFGMRVMF